MKRCRADLWWFLLVLVTGATFGVGQYLGQDMGRTLV